MSFRRITGWIFVDYAMLPPEQRTGDSEQVRALVDELSIMSQTFRELWQSQEVSQHGEGIKRLCLPDKGILELEYSTFAVEGRPGLSLVVFNPRHAGDREKMSRLMESD